MSNTDVCEQRRNFIRPYRNIPFDIGAALDEKDIASISDSFAKRGFDEMPVPALMRSFSKYIRFVFKLNEDIRLYIYSFGIGVFAMRDNDYVIPNEKYAADYCESRKNGHHEILKGNHKYSDIIFATVDCLRKLIASNHNNIRKTANTDWENNGLSYVMTVSAIQLNDVLQFGFQDLSVVEQRNLLVMMEPGLVHQEDSLLLENHESSTGFDLYSAENLTEQIPTNWMRSKEMGLYISWAAVIIYLNRIDENAYRYIEYMEADLQAMWMYVYCLYYVITHKKETEMKASQLKKELFSFKRMYNEFTDSNDSSVAEYFENIRNELIRTSGIEEEKEKYIEYLNFCIEDIMSLSEERARKYTVFSEILLFIIAYAQIAPLLYHFLMGDYVIPGTWQIIVVVAIAIIGTMLIIRKD